jgi:hypothetical protein
VSETKAQTPSAKSGSASESDSDESKPAEASPPKDGEVKGNFATRWKARIASSSVIVLLTALGGAAVWMAKGLDTASTLSDKLTPIYDYFTSDKQAAGRLARWYINSSAERRSELAWALPDPENQKCDIGKTSTFETIQSYAIIKGDKEGCYVLIDTKSRRRTTVRADTYRVTTFGPSADLVGVVDFNAELLPRCPGWVETSSPCLSMLRFLLGSVSQFG